MSGVKLTFAPRMRDLGGFTVGRVLPYAKQRMVGPFIFLDEMGPAEFQPGEGIDVRPHPHIGLATVTYLFEGEMRHRDSLGFNQVIRPGDVNLMTAGAGISHSERTDDERRKSGQRMHGLQSWIALPNDKAEASPNFQHYKKDEIPNTKNDGCEITVVIGDAFGVSSPVETLSPTFYAIVTAPAGATLIVPGNYDEMAVYVISGEIAVDGETIPERTMAVFNLSATPKLTVSEAAHFALVGGDNIGERKIWWNLVAVDDERIEKAKRDWQSSIDAGFSGSPFSLPPEETEFIPLPEN